ncbi:hypothetical protein D3C75_1050480 [compost metagenome]
MVYIPIFANRTTFHICPFYITISAVILNTLGLFSDKMISYPCMGNDYLPYTVLGEHQM